MLACASPSGIQGIAAAPRPLPPVPCHICARSLGTGAVPGRGWALEPPLSLPCSIAAAVLSTALPTPVQAAPPVPASSPAQPRPPAQPQTLFQTPPPLLQTTPAILPQPTAATAAAAPTPKPVDATPQITVQPAGFAFSPGIVSRCPHPGLQGMDQSLGQGWNLPRPSGGPAP